MSQYVVAMRSPRTGAVERYRTEVENEQVLESALDVFRCGGYEVLSCEEVKA